MKSRLLLLVLALAVAAKAALVLWGADRGFEIGDEGLFLLSLNHPTQAPPGFEFYKLLGLLPHPPFFRVVAARLLRAAFELIAASVLAWGVSRWWRRSTLAPAWPGTPVLVGFSLLGVFLGAGSRGLSYNDMTTLCTSSAVAALLVLTSLPEQRAAARRGWAVAAGAATGFQLLVKFPSAILLSALATAYIVAFLRRPGAVLVAFWAALVAGCVVPMAALYDAAGLAARFQEASLYRSHLDYGILQVLSHYWYFDIASHTASFRMATASGLTYVLLEYLRRRGWARVGADDTLAAAIAVGAVVLLWSVRSYHPFNVDPSLLYLFSFLPLTAIALTARWVTWARRQQADGRAVAADACAILLLVALPFVDVAGTNVALTLKIPSHAPPLFLAVAIAAFALRAHGTRRSFALVTAVLIGLSCVIPVQLQLYWPYGVPTPLTAQNVAVERPVGLQVDEETARFLTELLDAGARAGIRENDPIVALDFMPGLVHFLRGSSPGALWYTPNGPRFACEMLGSVPAVEQSFLLLGRPIRSIPTECLRTLFPAERYEVVAQIRNPYRKVYPYFFAMPEFAHVYLYAPVKRDALDAARP